MKILILFYISFLSFPLWARNWEYYTNYKLVTPINKSKNIFFNFGEEIRYKKGINYYRKSSFGLSRKIGSHLSLGFYYGFKSKRGNNWHLWHMFWPQLDYNILGRYISFSSSTKLERHCHKDRYRIREKVKFVLPWGKKISFFFGDEGRIFSLFSSPYGGENEVFSGLAIRLSHNLCAEIYYDLRRTKKDGVWYNTNCLRTGFNFKF